MNSRKGKTIWNVWLNKTEERRIQDALEDDNIGDIFTILKEVIKRGDLEKR